MESGVAPRRNEYEAAETDVGCSVGTTVAVAVFRKDGQREEFRGRLTRARGLYDLSIDGRVVSKSSRGDRVVHIAEGNGRIIYSEN
jgi:hypothetical protein